MKLFKRRLTAKLIALCLSLTIGIAILVGALSINITGAALEDMVEDEMIALTEQTSSTIEASMDSFFSFLEGMATSPMVYNTDTDPIVQKTFFLQTAANKGFGDIGFAPESGQTLTSNMETFADISQREYFQKALSGEKYSSDPLEDSVRPGVMIMLLAVPVYENGDSSTNHIVGVLYARMDGNFLSDSTKDITFGKTGYVFMVNKNGTTIGYPDSEKVISQENIIEMYGEDKAYQSEVTMLKEVLANDTGYTTYQSGGKEICVGYAGTTEFGWHILVCAEKSELYAGQNRAAMLLVLAIIVSIVVASFTSFLFSRKITAPIKKLNQVNAMLSEGDLKIQMDGISAGEDEVGQMIGSTSIFLDKLREVIAQTKKSSEKVNSISHNVRNIMAQSVETSDTVSHSIEGIAEGTVSQSEEVEHAAQEIHNLADAVDQINADVRALMECVEEANNAEKESTGALADLIASNDKTTDSIHKIAEQIKETNDAANNISQAATLITEIASQTNLLSLNASIEAARAGEAGRGFAVVASEIQHLSEQSNEAARTIQQIIEDLVRGSENSISKMEETLILVNDQQKKLELTQSESEVVNNNITQIYEGVKNIESSTTACESVKIAVDEIITNLSAVSEENAASTSETNGAMQELNANINIISGYTEELTGIVGELDQSIRFWQTEQI